MRYSAFEMATAGDPGETFRDVAPGKGSESSAWASTYSFGPPTPDDEGQQAKGAGPAGAEGEVIGLGDGPRRRPWGDDGEWFVRSVRR